MICLRIYVFHMYVSVAIESDDRCIIVIIGLCIHTIHIYFIGKTSAIMAVGLFIKSLIQTEKTNCPAIAKRVKENTVLLTAVYNWVILLRLYLLFLAENYRKTTKWLAKLKMQAYFFAHLRKDTINVYVCGREMHVIIGMCIITTTDTFFQIVYNQTRWQSAEAITVTRLHRCVSKYIL